MILVLSGTRDGREIVRRLLAAGHQVAASVVSDYGAELLSDNKVEILAGRFGQPELENLITEKRIKLIVDATHPYAELISHMAQKAASQKHIPYIRYQRPQVKIPIHPLIHQVKDYHLAAVKASELGETIFLTTGSKNLQVFTDLIQEGKRIVARVLPDENVINHCLNCGLTPADIIAMQGPFSKKLNQAMLEQTGADVMISKESGKIGGADTKVSAAMEMGIPIVLIERPPVEGKFYNKIEDILDEIDKIITKSDQEDK